MKLGIGDTTIEVISTDKGKCIHLGKTRCLAPNANLQKEQKALGKAKRCKGRNEKCELFCGASPFVPPYDKNFLLPEKETKVLAMALKDASNILLVGPPGCLSGETIIGISRGNRHHSRFCTLEEAYHKFNHLPFPKEKRTKHRKKPDVFWNKSLTTNIMSLEKGGISGYHEIEDIYYSGIKETYTVTSSSGKKIRVTKDHRFKVPKGTPGADKEGFKRLKDLKVGNKIIVRSKLPKGKGKIKRKENKETVVGPANFHPHAQLRIKKLKYEDGSLYKEYQYRIITKAKAVYEAKMNNLSLKKFIFIIGNDKEKANKLKYLQRGIQIHHKDRNPENNKYENLEAVPKSEHSRIHGRKEHRKHLPNMRIVIRKITSIEYYGKEKTYDIKMKSPYSNFIAQDFVVHNSGKTTLVKQLAAILNWGLLQFSCSEETSSSKIIGQWVVADKQMEWADGYVTSAMRNGYILLEDEADFMRPELRGELHSAMEAGGQLTLSSLHPETHKPFQEVIRKHPNFRWVSSANTVGHGDDAFQFHGTQYMNSAARDRYDLIMQFSYKREEEEIKIITQKGGVNEELARSLVGIANECRSKENIDITFQFSMRRLLSWAKHWKKLGGETASELCVLNFCTEQDKHFLKSLMRSHLGLDID